MHRSSRDLLSSIQSVEDADKKMAELGAAGRIDPAFLQISARAYGAARDTEMTKDEAKWVAYKLYRHARDHFDRQQPKARGAAQGRGAGLSPQRRPAAARSPSANNNNNPHPTSTTNPTHNPPTHPTHNPPNTQPTHNPPPLHLCPGQRRRSASWSTW